MEAVATTPSIFSAHRFQNMPREKYAAHNISGFECPESNGAARYIDSNISSRRRRSKAQFKSADQDSAGSSGFLCVSRSRRIINKVITAKISRQVAGTIIGTRVLPLT